MKSVLKTIFLIGFTGSLMLYSGCKGKSSSSPSIEDQQLQLLSGAAWTVSTATKDLVNQKSPDYDSFTLTLSGTKGNPIFNYTTAGRTGTKYPWATSGTFEFDATNPATTVTRDDGVTITYAATATQLTMSFTYSGPGFAARTNVVTGYWVFNFTR